MKILEFKIPTRHSYWKVVVGGWRYNAADADYFVADGNGCRHIWNEREIPKSVKRRARCFLKDPDHIGTERHI